MTENENSILVKLRNQAKNKNLRPRSKDAYSFYMKQVNNINVDSNSFLNDSGLITRTFLAPGQLIYYKYHAITEDLKYWDKFPMTLVINAWRDQSNGKIYFDGLNFHYLPPNMRYDLMIELLKIRNNNRYDKTTKLSVSYSMLSQIKEFTGYNHAYKKYLLSQVRSPFKQVEVKYMDIAINLPLAQWQSNTGNAVSDTNVWLDA